MIKNTVKYIFIPFTTLILLIVFSVFSSADTIPSIEVKTETISANMYSVSVYSDSPYGVCDIDISVRFDNQIFSTEGLSTENTDISKYFVDIESINPDASVDSAVFIYESTVLTNEIKFSGYFLEPFPLNTPLHICNIVFTAAAEPSETCFITVDSSVSSGDFLREQSLKVFLKQKSSKSVETATPRLLGDTDADGTVSAVDARNALRYSVSLDSFSVADFPYINADYDDKITSNDARYILRASVGLEKETYHSFDIFLENDTTCEKGGTYHFTCRLSQKTYLVQFPYGEHYFNKEDCKNSNICLICREKVGTEIGHQLTENDICTVCFAENDIFTDTDEHLTNILDEAEHFDSLAASAIKADNISAFIQYTQSATALLKDAAKLCSKVTGFEYTYSYINYAYLIRVKAFFDCTDADGCIETSKKNANTISNAVSLSDSYLSRIN